MVSPKGTGNLAARPICRTMNSLSRGTANEYLPRRLRNANPKSINVFSIIPALAVLNGFFNSFDAWTNAFSKKVENHTHSVALFVYCGPVLRHPAGPIQAANFRSAIAF